MGASEQGFADSMRRSIELNRARSGSERMLALCELLDAARAMAPAGPAARERRLRALAVRNHDRENWRAEFRRVIAAQRPNAPTGV